jgi:hypothetical protein
MWYIQLPAEFKGLIKCRILSKTEGTELLVSLLSLCIAFYSLCQPSGHFPEYFLNCTAPDSGYSHGTHFHCYVYRTSVWTLSYNNSVQRPMFVINLLLLYSVTFFFKAGVVSFLR